MQGGLFACNPATQGLELGAALLHVSVQPYLKCKLRWRRFATCTDHFI